MSEHVTEVYPDHDGWQLVVHRAPVSWLPNIRQFAAEHGYEIVDARWRCWDGCAAIFCAVTFIASGHELLLALALWSGLDWAHSFPWRTDR